MRAQIQQMKGSQQNVVKMLLAGTSSQAVLRTFLDIWRRDHNERKVNADEFEHCRDFGV